MSILSILLASLLGSVHCAAMCGGFVTIAADGQPRPVLGLMAYNVGRLVTYAVLGVCAGFLGQSLDAAGVVIGCGHAAALGLGGILVLYGLMRLLSGERPNAVSRFLHQRMGALYRDASRALPRDKPIIRAFGIGLLSTLLPCGWLYGFAAVAAATADPLEAVGVMGVFWLGTLPMMVSLGAFARSVLRHWGAQVPAISSALLILAGLFSIGAHFNLVGTGHRHRQVMHIEVGDGELPSPLGGDYCGPPERELPVIARPL